MRRFLAAPARGKHFPRPERRKRGNRFMKLAIGIDTGGTSTDAVLYDLEAGRVVGQSKAPTTRRDLSQGILAALDGLDPALCRQAETAGLSTTLATNACVEGKFRRTRLLLMGIDRRGVERYGAEYGFSDPDEPRYLPCRTTISGQVLEEPDWETLRRRAREWFSDAECCAVCEIHGMRNGCVLEEKAARIIEAETGLPVVCASRLFSGLSCLERAASAVLNAGLLPVTQEFLTAVATAFRARGIRAPMYIVRSDGRRMGLSYTVEHAVETLLSGPAASALGGGALTRQKRAVVVDIGGTTTDVALIEDGEPLLSDDGVRVGPWKTQVCGLAAASFALGGDSAIRWNAYDELRVGPDRVRPLCALASEHPEILPVLREQVRDVPAHTLPLHEFLTLERENWRAQALSETDAALCRALEAGPLSVRQAADALGVDKYRLRTETLEQRGIVLRAGLTPTDLMHVRGEYTAYDREASVLALRFAAASLHLSPEALCRRVYDHISREVFRAVLQVLFEHASPHFRKNGLDDGVRELLRLQWETCRDGGSPLLRCGLGTPAALIGIGGPVRLFLPAAAKALGAACIVPDCAPTANAVGAAAGQLAVTARAEIRPHGLNPTDANAGDFEVLCEGLPPQCFGTLAEASAWAVSRLKERTGGLLREQGAAGEPAFAVSEERGEAGPYLAARIAVTASVGPPRGQASAVPDAQPTDAANAPPAAEA